jgi:hypothetical protein
MAVICDLLFEEEKQRNVNPSQVSHLRGVSSHYCSSRCDQCIASPWQTACVKLRASAALGTVAKTGGPMIEACTHSSLATPWLSHEINYLGLQ